MNTYSLECELAKKGISVRKQSKSAWRLLVDGSESFWSFHAESTALYNPRGVRLERDIRASPERMAEIIAGHMKGE